VGWGTGFVDFDHKGWEDLFISNGHAVRFPHGDSPRRQPPVLLRNQNGRFTKSPGAAGPIFASRTTAAAWVLPTSTTTAASTW